MNNRWSGSSSNIVPWCRNNNLSIEVTKINDNNVSITSPRKFIEQRNNAREPIISVQAQQQVIEEIPLGIKCKSNYTVRSDDYLKKGFLNINM
jgi:hypothetical protein